MDVITEGDSMAYVSHSGTNNASQYDWKILIFMVLLLVSILGFVAVKFLFPGAVVETNAVFPDQAKSSAPAAAPLSKANVVPQIISPEHLAEKKTDVIAPVAKTTAVNDQKESIPKTVDSVMKPEHDVQTEIKPVQKTDTLLCSESDRASGLCQ